jgi:hypothetical protein
MKKLGSLPDLSRLSVTNTQRFCASSEFILANDEALSLLVTTDPPKSFVIHPMTVHVNK